jgi:hypothetical protein
MLDIAGGVVIAAFIIGLFAVGFQQVLVDENRAASCWGLALMLVSVALAIWLVFLRDALPVAWPQLK